MSHKLSTLFVFVLVFALALTACGPSAEEIAEAVVAAQATPTLSVEAQVAATVAAISTPTTQSVPTAQPTAMQADAPAPVEMSFVPYEPEGGIPYSGSEWNVDVAPDEIEVLTAGPLAIAGVSLPGGETRGSVLILLPGVKVVTYKVTNLLPGANWHASYRPLKVDETTWRALAADRVSAMQMAPNCSKGTGCKVVDVLIVGPNGVVARWTVQ